MSAVDELAAAQNGAVDPRDTLTALLELGAAGMTVTGADVFGRGPKASVDLNLKAAAGTTATIQFERFSDIGQGSKLTAYLVTCTGVAKSFSNQQAAMVAACVFQIAQHHESLTEDESARDWGLEYLRLAVTQELDLDDQADRWRAFCALAAVNPARDAGEDRSSAALAANSLVLCDRRTSIMLVRAGWYQQYVRREAGGLYSPGQLSVVMQRVGWQRPGTEGRVHAREPGGHGQRTWAFYRVPADWGREP